MQSTSSPVKVSLPFANNAGGPYKRQVPIDSQVSITPGAASFTDGFPPVNFQPIESGGVPPFGQDFNGLLFQLSGWIRWMNAGAPVFFDNAFSTAVGGYPKGAIVLADNATFWYLSTVENNTNNPNTVSTGWISVIPSTPGNNPPLIDGAASPGTSIAFARQDHVHPTDTSRAALSYVNTTFETINGAATKYLPKINPSSSGALTHTGNATFNGDIYAYRSGAASTGVIFLGNSGARYVFYDGSNYVMPGADLYLNGTPMLSTLNSTTNTANTALSTANTANAAASAAQTSANQAKTQAIGSTFPIGGGYQDLTASRALNTVYTNSKGRVIFVFMLTNDPSTTTDMQAFVNGQPAARTFTVDVATLCFVVPNGATYQINRASGNGVVSNWYETF